MKKPTREQSLAALRSDAQDCVGPKSPEAACQMTLRLGGSELEAEQAARFAEIWNEKHGFARAKAS